MNKNKDRLFYLFVFSGFLLIYLLSISQNIAISHDSIFYVLGVKQGLWEFHPHHLIYHVFNQAVYSFVRLFVENADISFVMSAVNSVFGALTVTVIVKLINKIYGYDKFTSLAYAGIIAFSYGVWFYSACVEVYIIPLYFIVLSYYSFLNNKNVNAGIYAGIATLFHQMYIFMLPVLLISWFAKKVKFREMLNSSLYYSAIVGIPYILVLLFYYNVTGISDSFNVLTKYAHELPQHWSSFGLTIVINDIIGLGRSVLSIHYLFGFENIQTLLFEKFPHNSFMEEIYLVRNMPDTLKYILAFFNIVLVIALIRLIIKAIMNMFRNNNNWHLKVWFFAYIIIFGLFFSFWSSNNPEFWISIYTISMLSMFRFLKPTKTEKIIAGVMFILMLLFNLLSTIQYAKDPMNDYYLNRIASIESEISENDIFIYDSNYMVGDYFRYLDYNNTLAVSKHNSVGKLFSALDTMKTQDSKIFLIESAFSPDFKISEKYKNFRDTISQNYKLDTINKDEIKFEIIKY